MKSEACWEQLAYSLSALQFKRVVHQELDQWSASRPKLAIYRDSVTAFAQDAKMTPSERSVLRTLAKNLGLTDADTKAIESAAKFTE